MKLLRAAGIAACAVACAAFAEPNPASVPSYEPGKAAVLRPAAGKPVKTVYDNAYRNMFEYVLVGPEWTLWKDGDKDACACLAEMVEYGHAREIRTVVELPKGLEASARETLLTNLVKAGVEGVCSSSAEDSKRLFVFFANGKDNVHPSKEGAKVFAQVFLDELKKRPGHRAATLFKPEALK